MFLVVTSDDVCLIFLVSCVCCVCEFVLVGGRRQERDIVCVSCVCGCVFCVRCVERGDLVGGWKTGERKESG